VEVDMLVVHHKNGTFRPLAVFAMGELSNAPTLVADEGEGGQTWAVTLSTGKRVRLVVDLGPAGRQDWWLLAGDGEESESHAES
jgi:hypothetical protein